jgi:hypothetical protein
MIGTLMPQRLTGALPEKSTATWSSAIVTSAASGIGSS